MRDLLRDYFDGNLSRRGFLNALMGTGLTIAAARSVIHAADTDLGGAADADRFRAVNGTGGELLVEQISAAGTKYIFTNPGSFEVGFFDAVTVRPELQVIVGLHEGIVVAMADGYHKVTREPAFVNVHAIGGTAQIAGQLYNAHVDGSAMVVTAGMLDLAYSDDSRLAPRAGFHQSEVNRQFTKISWEVRNGGAIPVATRRAFKTASTAPGGPVYIAYSTAALETRNLRGEIWPRETFLVDARPRPATDRVERLAKLLVEAERPVALFGDEVWRSAAQAEAVELCELLGLPASTDFYSQAFCNFPIWHPQYVGMFENHLPYPAGHADFVVQCGARDLGGRVIPEKPLLDPSARLAAIGMDTDMLGRTQPVDLAIVADVKETLRDLLPAVKSMATAARLQKIREARLATVLPYVSRAQAKLTADARANMNRTPIHPDQVGYEVDRAVERDAIIVSENLGGSNDLFHVGHGPQNRTWIKTAGHSLGWGVGAAIGAKLGAPDRQVVLSIGDGSVMYSAAGFWTMARYDVPVLTVVWNNHNYQTVRNRFALYDGQMAKTGHYHGMYLGDPEIDFVKLAESQGVPGERVTSVRDIAGALQRGVRATRDGRPYLVDIIVSRVGPGAESTWHQKFSLAAQRARMV
jgi:thiamine pyrophosphate-dependent acetolactate synthase large subunit-like protein